MAKFQGDQQAVKFSYYTQESFDKLHKELADLKTKGRSDMAKQIAEARDKGDLSENAEYDAAKDAQGLLELKISKMENIVASARVLDENDIDTSVASVMTKVKVKNLKIGNTIEYTLVSEEDANLAQMKISVLSPIGKGLLGKKVGEIAEITVPAGTLQMEILDIVVGEM